MDKLKSPYGFLQWKKN